MGLSTFPGWPGLKVIPAMQAYLIKVTDETMLTLNYDEMVRSTPGSALTEKLRAPKRRTVHNEDKTLTRLRVADSRTHTDLYFVEGDVFSDAFDNGWEATYMPNEGASPQFYAMGVKGKMAVLATDDFEGTVVGFEPGKETAYTISFSGAGNGYYLNDVKTQASTLIIDGEVYSFEYEAGDDANRFYISRTQLCSRFKKATGTSVGGYIAVKRLLTARELLLQGGKPTEVYGLCGYHDYSTFFRAYTKYFGHSPRDAHSFRDAITPNTHILMG
jgi:AraC-like DNA-binding protein